MDPREHGGECCCRQPLRHCRRWWPRRGHGRSPVPPETMARPRCLRAQGKQGPGASPSPAEGACPVFHGRRPGRSWTPGDRAHLAGAAGERGHALLRGAMAASVHAAARHLQTAAWKSCWAPGRPPGRLVREQDTPPAHACCSRPQPAAATRLILESHTGFWGARLALRSFAKGLQWSWVQGGLRPHLGAGAGAGPGVGSQGLSGAPRTVPPPLVYPGLTEAGKWCRPEVCAQWGRGGRRGDTRGSPVPGAHASSGPRADEVHVAVLLEDTQRGPPPAAP